MKGFLTVFGLLAALLPLKALYARKAAARDPIDADALKKVNFMNATGSGGYQPTGAGEPDRPKQKQNGDAT